MKALTALQELAPCVGDIKARFAAGLQAWSTFRDDAAHIIDRTLREPIVWGPKGDNQAALNASTWDWEEGTLVVGYDSANDRVVTGTSSLDLGKAIERASEIYGLVSTRVNEETLIGNIEAPIERTAPREHDC